MLFVRLYEPRPARPKIVQLLAQRMLVDGVESVVYIEPKPVRYGNYALFQVDELAKAGVDPSSINIATSAINRLSAATDMHQLAEIGQSIIDQVTKSVEEMETKTTE